MLELEGRPAPLEQAHAVFVAAGARLQFTAYEHMSVLVAFARRSNPAMAESERSAS